MGYVLFKLFIIWIQIIEVHIKIKSIIDYKNEKKNFQDKSEVGS